VDEPALRELGLGLGHTGRLGPRLLTWITQQFGDGAARTGVSSPAVGLGGLVDLISSLALCAPRACVKILVNAHAIQLLKNNGFHDISTVHKEEIRRGSGK